MSSIVYCSFSKCAARVYLYRRWQKRSSKPHAGCRGTQVQSWCAPSRPRRRCAAARCVSADDPARCARPATAAEHVRQSAGMHGPTLEQDKRARRRQSGPSRARPALKQTACWLELRWTASNGWGVTGYWRAHPAPDSLVQLNVQPHVRGVHHSLRKLPDLLHRQRRMLLEL